LLADTINRFIESRLSSVYTAIPGVVKKISGNIADIQPAVSETGVVLPVLPDVPLVFPSSKTAGFVYEVSKGDSVLLIFCSSSIDEWLAGDGAEADTDDPRRFDITDAVAIPGLFSLSETPKLDSSDGCVMNHEDTTITIKKNGDIVIGGDSAKKLVNEEFKEVFNDHVHNFFAAPTGTFSTSKPAVSLSTAIPPIPTPVGGEVALFGTAITDKELTDKTSAV